MNRAVPCGGAVAEVHRHHRTHQNATERMGQGLSMARELRIVGSNWRIL